MIQTSVWLEAGLGFGDESKGSIVDSLVRLYNAKAVVRYNGGAQAGHRVVLSDGREHIFSQFGSGTFVPGVLTYLSRFVLVEPFGLMREYEHLRELGYEDAFSRLSIDEDAPIITPFHIATNRIIELARSGARHGSCGLGIWETALDVKELGKEALLARDLFSAPVLRKKLLSIRARKMAKVQDLIPTLPQNLHRIGNCFFTVAPGFNFVLDFYPTGSPIFCVSACSAHGFKHSAGIGEAIAELLIDGHSSIDLQHFRSLI